jgi:hypothetical protein
MSSNDIIGWQTFRWFAIPLQDLPDVFSTSPQMDAREGTVKGESDDSRGKFIRIC